MDDEKNDNTDAASSDDPEAAEDSSTAKKARRAFEFGREIKGRGEILGRGLSGGFGLMRNRKKEGSVGDDFADSESSKENLADDDDGESVAVNVIRKEPSTNDAGEQGVRAEGDSAEGDIEDWEEVAEEIQQLRASEDTAERLIKALQEEAQENYDKYVRAMAELDNFKKRSVRERSELIKYAGEALARDLLDVVDDLERAVAQTSGSPEEIRQGVELILKRFQDTLSKHSIVADDASSSQFDPNKHEALAVVPSAELEPGLIIEQFRKAYFFKDKLLRPGQVVVASAPPAEDSVEEERQE